MKPTLYLSDHEHRSYVDEVLLYRDRECGRALFGRRIDTDFVVGFLVPAGPGAHQTRVRFSPDADWQQVHSDVLHARVRARYLGDLHSHPGSFDVPSAHDLKTAQAIVSSPEWATPEAVYPIAVIDGATVRIRAFLITRATLEFDEIPLSIIPDTHPLMTTVLTGTDAPQQEVPRAPEDTSRRAPRRASPRRVVRRAAAALRRLASD